MTAEFPMAINMMPEVAVLYMYHHDDALYM